MFKQKLHVCNRPLRLALVKESLSIFFPYTPTLCFCLVQFEISLGHALLSPNPLSAMFESQGQAKALIGKWLPSKKKLASPWLWLIKMNFLKGVLHIKKKKILRLSDTFWRDLKKYLRRDCARFTQTKMKRVSSMKNLHLARNRKSSV